MREQLESYPHPSTSFCYSTLQRIIVMDAIRTDFKKNSLTTASAIGHWVSSALADTSVSRRLSLSSGDTDWEKKADGTGEASGSTCWVSSMARWVGEGSCAGPGECESMAR